MAVSGRVVTKISNVTQISEIAVSGTYDRSIPSLGPTRVLVNDATGGVFIVQHTFILAIRVFSVIRNSPALAWVVLC